MGITKFQQALRDRLKDISAVELDTIANLPVVSGIVRMIQDKEITSIRINECREADINSILGLDTTGVNESNCVWNLPTTVKKRSPSHRAQSFLKDIKKYWNANSENTTRTIVDHILLDIVSNGQSDVGEKLPFLVWGEVPCKFINRDKSIGLNGSCDYCIGFGKIIYIW